MSAPQNFRSAFNGFNREDVVRYLEYINTKHNAHLNQLNTENDYLRTKLGAIEPDADLAQEREMLMERVRELEERCAQLEEQLTAAQTAAAQVVPVTVQTEVPAPQYSTSEELEAYRRAERTERMARERAELVYHQVNGVLAEATAKVDGVAADIGVMADQVMTQLSQLQIAVSGSKQALQEAVSTMYAIKPNV